MMLLCSCYGYNPITQTFTLKVINALRNYSGGKGHYLKHCVKIRTNGGGGFQFEELRHTNYRLICIS